MPYPQLTERAWLDGILGGKLVGQINANVTAPAAAQTSIAVRGSSGSGNMDITAVSGQKFYVVTPGTGANINAYTNDDIITAGAGSTATSLAFASQTLGKTRAIGDLIFLQGPNPGLTNPAPDFFIGTGYVGLSTAGAQTTMAAASDLAALPQGTLNVVSTTGFPTSGNLLVVSEAGLQNVAYTGTTGTTFTGCSGGTGTVDTGDQVQGVPTAATILANEPTSSNGYARVASVNNAANWPASTGNTPASKSNGTLISFPASVGGGFSSGASNLVIGFLADAPTLAGGNVFAWGYLGNPQTVNAAGITVTIGIGGFALTLI